MTDKSLWDIRAVRGPRTAEKLGIDPEFGIIDPAVMVAGMPEFRNLPKTNGTIFIPHWESTIGSIWPVVCQTVGVTYIDPRGEAKAVISAIAQSELVIAESMHAAILADAFRVPWVAVSTSEEINAFKWSDWADTVEVAYRPRQIPVSSRNEAMHKGARFWGMRFENRWRTVEDPNKRGGDTLVAAKVEPRQSTVRTMAKQVLAAPSAMALWQAKRATPQLSSDTVLARRKERFLEVIAGVQRDYF
jgi:succinoglycan biosynthesis protein ExoV